jgi:hypothetical protein
MKYTYQDLEIERKGNLVKMSIVRMPNSCIGTKVPHFATFSYKDHDYIKRIPSRFCDDHSVGDLIEMKYLAGETKVLFPDESEGKEILYLALLGVFGLGITFYSWFKSKQ